jgi:hypothetical protein
MQRPKAMVLSALAALALACGGGSPPANGAAPEERTVLRVENDNFSDMRIYVWRNSQRIRIGVANAKSVTTIPLNRTIVLGIQTLRFEADPIGGRSSAVSEQITVTPGEEIVLRIPP